MLFDDFPEHLPVLSLWQPYAGLIAVGDKTIETRRWRWPFPPGWLVVHAARRIDDEAMARLGKLAAPHADVRGALVAVVWVAGCRPLVPDDETSARRYLPGLFAWPLERVQRFAAPIPWRGSQGFRYVDRAVVLQALSDVSKYGSPPPTTRDA